MFNPDIGKLDPKKVIRHFIGYSDKWKGYRFCCPKRHMKFIEIRHTLSSCMTS